MRHIFERYLKLRSVRLLREELTREGIVSKIRLSCKGIKSGGQPFSRGALYELLANPIYLGEIRHGKVRHPGQHPAIVDRKLWECVQRQLREQAAHHRTIGRGAVLSPLAGKLFDEKGQPLYACGANKSGRRYRYYVSRKVIQESSEKIKTWLAFASTPDRARCCWRRSANARRSASDRYYPAGQWRADWRVAVGARCG